MTVLTTTAATATMAHALGTAGATEGHNSFVCADAGRWLNTPLQHGAVHGGCGQAE